VVTGDIELALAYNYKQSTLEVHIKRCRGIVAVDTKRNSSDPSVIFTVVFFAQANSASYPVWDGK